MRNAATLLSLVLMAAVTASGCGGSGRTASTTAQASRRHADPTLKPHPHVVVALSPGEQPPPGATATYGSTDEAASFEPPSDAEVRQELGQLHASKLSGTQEYTDPLANVRGLAPERIDMGVDYAGAGPVVALGDGKVFNTEGAGWPGGTFIGITLARGPYAGLSYFVAEDVRPTVKVGDRVRAGQEIGVMYRGPAGIETGWAAGHGDEPLAAALGQQNKGGDPGAWSSAAGLSFDRLLISTGTPSGIPQGAKAHGTLPAQYP